MKYCILFLLVSNTLQLYGQKVQRDLLLKKHWVIESQDSDSTFVHWGNDRVTVDGKAGVTLWLDQRLEGHYAIEYDRKIRLSEVHFPRLSDMNQFWAAVDPKKDSPFGRNGKLESYNDLVLFYMGFGGNTNTTTRFRLYDGKGNRLLLKEYLNQPFLLKKDSIYHVRTEVDNKETKVWVNNTLLFSYQSDHQIPAGHFALRQTWSAQEISHFKIIHYSK